MPRSSKPAGGTVVVVAGEPRNLKLTVADDLELAHALIDDGGAPMRHRVGLGFDVHPFGDDAAARARRRRASTTRRGSPATPTATRSPTRSPTRCSAPAGLPDLGTLFPATDEQYRDADSMELLAEVAGRVASDRLVGRQRRRRRSRPKTPRLAPHIDGDGGEPRRRARAGARADGSRHRACRCKPKRGEGLGAIGRAEGIAVWAVALLTLGRESPERRRAPVASARCCGSTTPRTREGRVRARASPAGCRCTCAARRRTTCRTSATGARSRVRHDPALPALAGVRGHARLAGRPDLLVLGVPLLVWGGWSLHQRPTGWPAPVVRSGLAPQVLREGQAGRLVARLRLPPATDAVWLTSDAVENIALDPPLGARVLRPALPTSGRRWWRRALSAPPAPGTAEVALAVTPLRWGRRGLGRTQVGVTVAGGGFRWGPLVVPTPELTVLPVPVAAATSAPTPHPVGLVGQHRSRSVGEGSELAGVRPFTPGDRLRRINWRASLRPEAVRRGQLVVTATHADQDAGVLVVVDAVGDVGVSEGLQGMASSLDVTVRAAAGIVEHYLTSGDRVGMQVLERRRVLTLPTLSGALHRRRALLMLAQTGQTAGPMTRRLMWSGAPQLALGARSSSLVVLVSPLLSTHVLTQAVGLSRHRATVVVVDTLPTRVVLPEVGRAWSRDLAWRLRLLEHDHTSRALIAAGLPVVVWHGPGSLDAVLRAVSRRPPSMAGGRR